MVETLTALVVILGGITFMLVIQNRNLRRDLAARERLLDHLQEYRDPA